MSEKNPDSDDSKHNKESNLKNDSVDLRSNVSVSNKKSHSRAKFILIVVLILVLSAASYFAYNYFNSSGKDKVALVCAQNEELIRGSAKAMLDSNKDELKKFADQARSLNGNEKDQNCQYIYLNYYMLDGDVNNSKTTYDSYMAIYKENDDKFKELGLRLMTNEQIKNTVDFTSVQDKELIENARIRGQNVGNQ